MEVFLKCILLFRIHWHFFSVIKVIKIIIFPEAFDVYKNIVLRTFYPQTDTLLKVLRSPLSTLFYFFPCSCCVTALKALPPFICEHLCGSPGSHHASPVGQVQVPSATQKPFLTSHLCSMQLKLAKYDLQISELYFLLENRILLPPLLYPF